MKKLITSVLLAFVCFFLSAYRDKKGGDVFQLFWNGKQIHQQFVHLNTAAKAFQLSSFRENDQLEVVYSHCGASGTNRALIFRNEKNEILQTFRFADNKSQNSRMAISGKHFGKISSKKIFLYYRSHEIPNEKLLAVFNCTNGPVYAKK